MIHDTVTRGPIRTVSHFPMKTLTYFYRATRWNAWSPHIHILIFYYYKKFTLIFDALHV